jgi:hypothetical protein
MDTDSPSPVSLRETSSPRGGEGKDELLSPLPHGERTVLRNKTGEGEKNSHAVSRSWPMSIIIKNGTIVAADRTLKVDILSCIAVESARMAR